MAFTIASAPHGHSQQTTETMMRLVLLALLPGIAAQVYFFGYGVIIQLLLAMATAVLAESLILVLRKRAIWRHLADSSALLTGALLAVALPPLAPWWMVISGTAFAIIVAKQLYGGLGHNPFNPAMIAYVLLLVAFPSQMTSWLPATGLALNQSSLPQVTELILTGKSHTGLDIGTLHLTIDGMTSATPLDTIKTQSGLGKSIPEIMVQHPFGHYAGIGWEWVNLAYLAGGVFLILVGTISWRIPCAFLGTLAFCATTAWILAPDQYPMPLIHLLSGATMLGAFFIATDPVTAATTPRGRLLFGILIGLLVFIIRSFGGYPDAVAFAVLLANISTPMLDSLTRPRVYGTGTNGNGV